jgi:hypothetical protein
VREFSEGAGGVFLLLLLSSLFFSCILYIIRFSEYFGAFGVVVSGHSDLEGSLLATSLATASAWSLLISISSSSSSSTEASSSSPASSSTSPASSSAN